MENHSKADACDWTLLSHDESGKKTYFKVEPSGDLKVRITQVMNDEMIRENQFRANEWRGWNGKNHAIVASVPEVQWNKMKMESGWIPGTKNKVDWKHLRKKLNSSDYSVFRTGGGKL
jgi:hypothetical protein